MDLDVLAINFNNIRSNVARQEGGRRESQLRTKRQIWRQTETAEPEE